MLNVKFTVDMAKEVKSMLSPELDLLVTLATAWEGEKPNKMTPKVSIKSLLKLKKIGRTIRSKEELGPILVQTKIPLFFKKNSKRVLPEGDDSAGDPDPKKLKARMVDSDEDSQFSEPLLLNKPIEPENSENEGSMEPSIPMEPSSTVPDRHALDTTPEESTNSSSDNSDEDSGSSDSVGDSDNKSSSPKVVVDVIKKAEIQQHFVDFFDSEVGSAILNSVS